MKKNYITPEYEIEKYTIQNQICTASGGLLDGNTDIELGYITEEEQNYLNGGVTY